MVLYTVHNVHAAIYNLSKMQCLDCGKTLSLKCPLCLICYPPLTGKAYPLLVSKPSDQSRNASNCLEDALSQNGMEKKFFPSGNSKYNGTQKLQYYSALFKPAKGNGPYFADGDVSVSVNRMLSAAVGDRRFATIFRDGAPCHLSIDIDDSRPDRPEESLTIESVLAIATAVMIDKCGVAPAKDQWLISHCIRKNKTSVHADAQAVVFRDVKQCNNLMKHYKRYVESILEAKDPFHEHYDLANAVCWRDDKGRYKHAADCSIYHPNALLKTPYSAKPGQPPMLPIIFKGERVTDAEPRFDIILASLAHTPELFATPEKKLVDCPGFNASSSSSSSRQRGRPVEALVDAPLSHLETAAMALVEGRLLKTAGCNLHVSYSGKDSRGSTKLYVRYDGKHTCAAGGDHASNNARITINGKSVIFSCFSADCPNRFAMPDLPFSVAGELQEKKKVPRKI